MTDREATKDGGDMSADMPDSRPKAGATRKTRPGSGSGKEDAQVSQALKTVYQRAIDEDIPLEMLDLLRKLD